LKILILKPSSLGDVVHAMPVLRMLRRHYPESEIYWWIESSLAPLLDDDPDLTGLLRFDRKRWTRPRSWRLMWLNLVWARRQNFDLVIDLQGLARSASFAWLANGKLTVGVDSPREGARGFYDAVARRPSFHTHAVDWYLRVLPLLGLPLRWDFDWIPPNASVAQDVRRKWSGEHKDWIVIQPGARWLNKRWPAQSFAELLSLLRREYPRFRFAVLGSAADAQISATVAAGAPGCSLDLAGKATLPEMVEWIRLSKLMITNDTGPMHVAAALGKPLLALFGPTEPMRTGPYRQIDHALQLNLSCVPCLSSHCTRTQQLECLRALAPAVVFNAARARLDGHSR
jgi:lipopolysaccharide heptosyltransferase I